MRTKRKLSWLVVCMVLAYQSAPAVETDTTIPSDPFLKRLPLDDFEHIGTERANTGCVQTRQVYSPHGGSAIRFIIGPSRRQDSRGKSLYLNHTFDSSDDVEAGLRMDLHGLDASDYDHLVFWVRGDDSKGYADAFKVQFRRPCMGSLSVLEEASYIVTGVSDQWQRIVVPLNHMPGIRNWTNLGEFVISFHPRRSNVLNGASYIEDIAFVKTGDPGPSIWDKVTTAKKAAWEATFGNDEGAKRSLRSRLAGWPARGLVDRSTFPVSKREFLERLARDTWRGIDALRDREHGLPVDYVRFRNASVALESSDIGDYTSGTNVGLYLIAVIAALELDFIDRSEALERLNTTLNTLEDLETYQGFYYNYYDTTSLERTSNFVSSVDSAWLTTGLMVVRIAFEELFDRCNRLIEHGDFGLFYDDVEQLMSHGHYVNVPLRSQYRYGVLYSESRIASLVAIGKGDVPVEHWFRMVRTYPPEYAWQSLTPKGRKPKAARGFELTGGHYQWEGIDYVPSWGGSMFEALMPTLVVDEQHYAPLSLGKNNLAHATVQRRYALEELGYPVWGISPSSIPGTGGYSEYGVKILGSWGYRAGAVTPHASALALHVTPESAIANLRELIDRYAIYGEYGFYDSVEPGSGNVAHTYLVLDQAMMFIALANYLTDSSIQTYFASDPIARKALRVVGDEDFFN